MNRMEYVPKPPANVLMAYEQSCESRRQTISSISRPTFLRNLKGLVAIEIANAVRKKSLALVETAIRFFETQPRREREPDR